MKTLMANRLILVTLPVVIGLTVSLWDCGGSRDRSISGARVGDKVWGNLTGAKGSSGRRYGTRDVKDWKGKK